MEASRMDGHEQRSYPFRVRVGRLLVAATLLATTLVQMHNVVLGQKGARKLLYTQSNMKMISSPRNRRLLEFDFGSNQRNDRFPTVEERIMIYMSNWFLPPCAGHEHVYEYVSNGNETSLFVFLPPTHRNETPIRLETQITPDNLFFADNNLIHSCYESGINSMKPYCHDVINTILRRNESSDECQECLFGGNETPLLLQFGDALTSKEHDHVRIPHLKKFRMALDRDALLEATQTKECSTLNFPNWNPEPILWRLNLARHYHSIPRVTENDHLLWNERRNQAIFWGSATGTYEGNKTTLKLSNDRERCLMLPRCRLVYRYHNSSLVQAKLTKTFGRFADTIDGVELVGKRKRIEELLQFKGIIMLEGNDVASGLKWALISRSIVLMPKPTKTTWAMEELLQPWVHYVPLHPQLTDVEEKMQWVLDNPFQAQAIVNRSIRWMEDMLFGVDAVADNDIINREVLRRYRQHFVSKQSKINGSLIR